MCDLRNKFWYDLTNSLFFLVGILRLQDGCDYSALISKEEQIIIPENAGDTEAETEKEKANKDDNSDDVEQGNYEFIRCFTNLSPQFCPRI